jgi:GH25 family lysozyme M1 (1,4-beta-N-acetylmuramidase)
MDRMPRRPTRLAMALLIALLALPALAAEATAATRAYIANCPVNLRTAASTSSAAVAVIPAGATVSVASELAGDSWSADCAGAVSGSRWFSITAINGVTTTSLYGASQLYAAKGLFRAANLLEGIDVSTWQGTIDYAKVAASGRRFVVAKATEGIGFTDPKWALNRTAAPAAGLRVTGYHFARPDLNPTDAVGEADWFVSQLGLVPGMLVPALDLERHGTLSAAALQAWVGAWLDEVYAKTGVRPMIYTSPSFWKSYVGDTRTFADEGYTILWVAHWFVSNPSVPAQNWGGHGWTFWQYDDCGTVPGMSGCVDLDRYHGLDLTSMTVGADFGAQASPAKQSVKQGGSVVFAIGVTRQFYTLPVSLSVTGLPAGATATITTSAANTDAATLAITTSKTDTVTPVGTYPLTVTASSNGLIRTATASLTVGDGIAPVAGAPAARLMVPPASVTTAPVKATWSGADPSGIAGYALQWQVDGGTWSSRVLTPVTTTWASGGYVFGHTYRQRVQATDGAGNVGSWAYGPVLLPVLTQQTSSSVTYSGAWSTVKSIYASGGSLKYATSKGASASFTFIGSSIGWLSYLGPNRGKAAVYLDGIYKATVSMYSATYSSRRVVYVGTWATSGSHTIKVVDLGTSGHSRIDLDGFIRLTPG